MKIKVPYLISKPGAKGTRYFWQPSTELRKLGWRPCRLVHQDGRPATTLDEAVELAKARNAELDAWRKGGAPTATTPAAPEPVLEVRAGSVAHMIRLYKADPRFTSKAEKTRYEYTLNLAIIEKWAGDSPVKAITRDLVQDYYKALYETGKHAKANAVIRMLRILLQFCWDNKHVAENAAERPKLVSTAPRLRIWSDAEIDAFVAAADKAGWPSIGDAVVYGVYLGQRQGDLLKLLQLNVQADREDGYRILLKQAKRGARVSIPLHPRAAARYKAAQQRRKGGDIKAPTILWNEQTKLPWNPHTFRHEFSAIRATVAEKMPTIGDAWFMDTRDTSVTKLAQAGCTVPEIASITGHDEESVYKVLKHYLALNGTMADAAIAKLVAWEEEQKRAEKGTGH